MAKKQADRPSDDEMTGTLADVRRDREPIPAIESAITKAKKVRVENAEIVADLDKKLATQELKLYELLREHVGELTEEQDKKGNRLRVYQNGDYRAAILDKETLQYDVISERQASK